jgi:hypothetical protein
MDNKGPRYEINAQNDFNISLENVKRPLVTLKYLTDKQAEYNGTVFSTNESRPKQQAFTTKSGIPDLSQEEANFYVAGYSQLNEKGVNFLTDDEEEEPAAVRKPSEPRRPSRKKGSKKLPRGKSSKKKQRLSKPKVDEEEDEDVVIWTS